jgi:F0F1-type ATP synthase membrane subunit b/b'
MGKPALEEIVAIEKEIQAQIAAERQKAEARLEELRAAIATESEAKIAECRQKCAVVISAAEDAARRAENARVNRAEFYEALLKELPDSKLDEYVRKYLPRILPENES